jgi:hypothetical protein
MRGTAGCGIHRIPAKPTGFPSRVEVTDWLFKTGFSTAKGAATMNERQNQKPKLTADAAYENAHLVAQGLAERIRELLFDLPAPGNDEHPIDWGHVGTISEVNKRLAAVVAFLDGTER